MQGDQYDILMVDAVPSEHLDTVKTWLAGVSLKYYEFSTNLDWRRLLRNVHKDLPAFCEKVSIAVSSFTTLGCGRKEG